MRRYIKDSARTTAEDFGQHECKITQTFKYNMDFLGKEVVVEEERSYVGSGAVWHSFPVGARCAAAVEERLNVIWNQHELTREGMIKEGK